MSGRAPPAAWGKLAIVAGAGALPVSLAAHCRSLGLPYYVARIAGAADPALQEHEGGDFGLGEMEARFRALRAAGCDALVFAGVVKRPEWSALKLDARAALMLPRVLAAAGRGDDALLRVLVEECEKAGFRVVGADSVLAGLLAPAGLVAGPEPSPEALEDIAKAAAIAAALGAWDIGQGLVVCAGLVLAVEAQEGTDAMLERVAALPEAIRGTEAAPRGVLVKRPKPQQERRIDLPTIGAATIARAAAAGLAGVAVEAGGTLIVDREAVRAAGEAAGLFVYGFDPAGT